MNVIGHNSLIFPLWIAQEIGEDEGTAGGRSDSTAENKKELPVAVPIAQRRTKISSLFLIHLPAPAARTNTILKLHFVNPIILRNFANRKQYNLIWNL